jgi:hypothetical protein
MTTIRSSGAPAALAALLMLVAAACGGSAASSAPADAGTGSGSGNGTAASADAGSGSGSGTAAASDAAKVGEQLQPPNSTETSKTTTGGYWYAIYHSSDSPDSLKSFFEGQIPKTGLQIVSTTTANGTYSWLVANDSSGTFGGSVTVGPGGDGSGSDVIVGIGSN